MPSVKTELYRQYTQRKWHMVKPAETAVAQRKPENTKDCQQTTRNQKRGMDRLTQMSTLQKYKMKHFCCLSHPTCRHWLWRSQKMSTCVITCVLRIAAHLSQYLLLTLKISGPSSIYEHRLLFAWAQTAWPKTSSNPYLLTLTAHLPLNVITLQMFLTTKKLRPKQRRELLLEGAPIVPQIGF